MPALPRLRLLPAESTFHSPSQNSFTRLQRYDSAHSTRQTHSSLDRKQARSSPVFARCVLLILIMCRHSNVQLVAARKHRVLLQPQVGARWQVYATLVQIILDHNNDASWPIIGVYRLADDHLDHCWPPISTKSTFVQHKQVGQLLLVRTAQQHDRQPYRSRFVHIEPFDASSEVAPEMPMCTRAGT